MDKVTLELPCFWNQNVHICPFRPCRPFSPFSPFSPLIQKKRLVLDQALRTTGN